MMAAMNQGTKNRAYNRLSAAFVRRVQEPGRYFDGHGLMLRVMPTGSKQWVQRIAVNGKRVELGLGGFPLVALAKAREQAFANRRTARTGGNPLGEKRRERADALSFEAAAREVFALKRKDWKNEKHAAQWIGTLEQFVFPNLGTRRVAEVSADDVIAVLKPLLDATPTTAKRVRQRIGVVLSWAQAKGLRQDNPADAVGKALRQKRNHPQAHHRALSYGEVSSAVVAVNGSRADPALKLAFELLVLTAARAGEIRFATWSEFDLKAAIWVVPASRMKAGREHRVPLSVRALDVLAKAHELGDGQGLVFASRRGSPLSERSFVQCLSRLGIDATAHGFRSSFRDWAGERTSTPREVCEAALAHTLKDKSEAAYARSDLFEKRRELMNAWARYLNPESSAVVSLDARREPPRVHSSLGRAAT